jgi:DNA-binding NarL/FixJ family response regulator
MVEKPLRGSMKRILIVEDNAFFLQFLKETMHLRFPWIDILEAANGEEAMRKIDALSPEAIFMDLRLPGENGLELTKKIKAQYRDIVVVILTNYDLPEYREAAYQSGADHFVSKDSFLNIVNSILTNQDIPKDGSNGREPVEKSRVASRPDQRRSETTAQDNGKNE